MPDLKIESRCLRYFALHDSLALSNHEAYDCGFTSYRR